MRNLKRALSLTLASVMLLGMMIVGTSAVSFNDADDISNVTAATVLQELGVMQGSGGNFAPDQTVTRGQMAILICKILYGDKLNADNFAGSSQFTDVPANAYYTGYVNLAAQLGIISGYGNGQFGPGDPVTTAQAALMLTRALGWFQAGELGGQNWTSNAIAAVEKATSVNLFGSLRLSNNDPLSRDNVCEMVFNAMTKTAPVQYSERWGTYYSDEGSIISGVKFNYLNSLGYKNFTLVYNTSEDDFGRPATEWGIGNGRLTSANIDDHGDIISATIRSSILKAEDEADLTYTKDVKISDIYKDLGKPSLKTSGDDRNTVSYKVDDVTSTDNEGAAVNVGNFDSNNDNKVGFKGALTEVYKDKDNDIKIVTINTYLVEASADYSERNGELSVTPAGSLRLTNSNKIKNEDVTVSQFKKDDLILVTGVRNSDGKLEIKTAELASLVEDVKVSAYNSGKAKDYVTAGGTKYEYNVNAEYDPDGAIDAYSLQNTAYTLVLDKAGYVIGVKKYSDEATLDDILFVKDAAKNGFNYQAKAVFMDGHTETITVSGTSVAGTATDYGDTSSCNNATDTYTLGTAISKGGLNANRFYEFNKKSNGEYELKDIANTRQGVETRTYTSGDALYLIDGDKVNPLPAGDKTANGNTVFIADDTLYAGVKNAPDVSIAVAGTIGAFYLMDTDGSYLLAVYTAESGVSVSSSSDYVYVLEAKGTGKDDNDKTYNIYNVVKEDGTQDKDYFAKGSVTPGLYEIRSSEDGYPKLETAREITGDNQDVWEYVAGVNSSAFDYKSGVVTAGTEGFKTDENTKVIAIDANDDKEVDNYGNGNVVKSLDTGTYNVCGVYVSKNDKNIKTLWVAKTSDSETLAGSPSADAINNALAQNGSVTVTGTVPSGVTVSSGETLTLSTGATSGSSIALDGGTVKLDGIASVPTFTGSGKVEVVGDITADISNVKSGSTTTGTANSVVTVADPTQSVELTGSGKLTTYSNTKSMSELAAYTGSTTFRAMDFNVVTAAGKDGTNIKTTYYTGSDTSNLTSVDAGGWKTPNADYGTGSSDGLTYAPEGSSETVTFYVGDKVTGVRITVTTPGEGGGDSATTAHFYFKIK